MLKLSKIYKPQSFICKEIFKKKSFFAIFLKALSIPTAFLINIILAKFCNAEIVGQYLLITSFVTFLTGFFIFGTNKSLVISIVKKSDSQKVNENLLNEGFLFAIFLSFLIFFVSMPFNYFIFEKFLSSSLSFGLIFIISFWISLRIFQTIISSLHHASFDFTNSALSEPGNFLRNVLFLFFLLLSNFFLLISLDSIIYISLISLLITLLINIHKLSFTIKIYIPEFKKFINIFLTGLPLFYFGILQLFFKELDFWISGYFFESEAIAVYRISSRFADLFFITQGIFIGIFSPYIIKFAAIRDKKSLKHLYKFISITMFFLSLLLFVVFILFGKDLLAYLFTDLYKNGYQVIIIKSFAYVIYSLIGPSAFFLIYLGKANNALRGLIVLTLIYIVTLSVITPIYGINGPAISFTVFLALQSILFFYYIFVKDEYENNK